MNSGSVFSGFPDNGTAFLECLSGPLQSPLSVTNIAGSHFSLVSVDLSEFATFYHFPETITFTGVRSDSTTVSVTFVTDGRIDGRGGIADFQRFSFPQNFTNLVSLTVDSASYAIDNLVVIGDEDGDGVPDDRDRCPKTPFGSIVNEDGCSIDQIVPCAGPDAGGTWKNHGQYMMALVAVANAFLATELITTEERNAIVQAAANSNCGKN